MWKWKHFFGPWSKQRERERERERFKKIRSIRIWVPGTCSCKTQSSIELVIHASEHSKAEIFSTLKSISTGYSNNSYSDNAGLFQHMFPDSEIAKSFQLGPTKIKYLTNFGIAPYYKSVLWERVKESPCFVISSDESLNPVTQTREMDQLARCFDETEERAKIRYLDSEFLGHGTSNDLKKNFNELLKVVDANKLIQVGMDGPNVNIKLLKMIQAEWSENEQHQLMDIGSCGLSLELKVLVGEWKKYSREPTKSSMIHLLDEEISSL